MESSIYVVSLARMISSSDLASHVARQVIEANIYGTEKTLKGYVFFVV